MSAKMSAQIIPLRPYQLRRLEQEAAAIMGRVIEHREKTAFAEPDTAPSEYCAPADDPA